jgi:hypothetical protein
MQITMRDAALLCIGVIIGVVLIGGYAHHRVVELSRTHGTARAQLEKDFIARAEQADRIEAIPESSSVVPDCTQRARFEELLSSLPTLQTRERTELDLLFASCGDYHARLKTFYAERLSSMSDRYSTMRTFHDALFSANIEEERIEEAMRTIVQGERTRASDLFSLVSLQRTMNDVYAGRSTRTLAEVNTEAGVIEKRFVESDLKIDEARAAIQSNQE